MLGVYGLVLGVSGLVFRVKGFKGFYKSKSSGEGTGASPDHFSKNCLKFEWSGKAPGLRQTI